MSLGFTIVRNLIGHYATQKSH